MWKKIADWFRGNKRRSPSIDEQAPEPSNAQTPEPTVTEDMTITRGLVIGAAAPGDDAEADWIARSTAAGVTFATDFRDASDFSTTNRKWAPGMNSTVLARVVQDTTDGITGGACLRIDTIADAASDGAAWYAPLNSAWTAKTQGFGSTPFWIQFRFKVPSSRLELSETGENQKGWKFANIAHYAPEDPPNQSASNRNDEHVLQDTNQRGFPQAYRRDWVGSFESFIEQFGESSEFLLQNAVDRGSPGTNCERYCLTNCWTISPWEEGAYPGCFKWTANEWVTCMVRIKVATYGTEVGTGNEFDFWYARYNATEWTHLMSFTDHSVGDPDEFTGGLNGIWLSTFETNRVGGIATHQKWDQLIVSTQEIALPAVVGYPSWVPDAGKYVALTAPNEMRDIAPVGGSGFQNLDTVIDNWNSAIFVPDVGRYGMYVNLGSGHSNRHDAIYGQVFVEDEDSSDWTLLHQLGTYPDDWSENSGQGRNSDGAIPVNVWDRPTPPHTYDAALHIPASVFGNTKGALCYPILQAVGDAAIARWYAWFYDLDTETWTTSTNAVPANAQTAFSSSHSGVWDSDNECVWLLAQGAPTHLGKLEKVGSPLNWTWTSVAHGSGSLATNGVTGGYCPDLACVVWWAALDGVLTVWHPGSSTMYWNPTQSGTPPASGLDAQYGCGLEWCPHPSINKFYGMEYIPNPSYPTLSASHYYPSPTAKTLTPPGSLPGTWTWGSETFTAQGGVTAIGNKSVNQRYNALRWMNPRNEAGLINAFAWANDVDGPTNILRPAAAT
jgi:hypothetical protein